MKDDKLKMADQGYNKKKVTFIGYYHSGRNLFETYVDR